MWALGKALKIQSLLLFSFIVFFFCFALPGVRVSIYMKREIVTLIMLIPLVRIYGGLESHIAQMEEAINKAPIRSDTLCRAINPTYF